MNHLVAKENEAGFGLNCCWDSRHTRTYSPGCNLPPLLTCSGGTLVYEHLKHITRVEASESSTKVIQPIELKSSVPVFISGPAALSAQSYVILLCLFTIYVLISTF